MSALRERLIEQFGPDATPAEGLQPGEITLFQVPREQFSEAARTMNYAEARLVAEWAADESTLGRGFGIYACFNKGTEFLVIKCNAPAEDPTFPTIKKKIRCSLAIRTADVQPYGGGSGWEPRSAAMDQIRRLARERLAVAQGLRPLDQDAPCLR